MIEQIRQPAMVPVQSIFRKDELVSLLGISEETFSEIDQWDAGFVTLERLLSFLRENLVKYELVP